MLVPIAFQVGMREAVGNIYILKSTSHAGSPVVRVPMLNEHWSTKDTV